MDQQLCDFEERARNGHGNRDRAVFQIEDFCLERDMVKLCDLLSEFYLEVNGENLFGEKKTFETSYGELTCYEVEARIYAYLHSGCKIKLAWVDGEAVGFLIYQPTFDGVIAIRLAYLANGFSGKNIMHKIVSDLKMKHVLFQTKKENEPFELLKITEKFRHKIHEDEHFSTWMMEWKGNTHG